MRFLAVSAALTFLLIGSVSAQAEPTDANKFLNALTGDFTMAGEVMGEPVSYAAHGERTLKDAFLAISMKDVATPPQYEAIVYIGYDAKAGDFVAHWLDNFGAHGARVVGVGRIEGDALVITFPYATGKFRDTFTLNTQKGWNLLIEAQNQEGGWETFASYSAARR